MKLPRFTIAALVLAAAASFAQAQSHTLGNLNGKYEFDAHGDRLTLLALIDQPMSDVGYFNLDGNGHVTSANIMENVGGTDSVVNDTGTYSLNADDSFTITLTGTESRRFNVFPMDVDPSTGIAQGLHLLDVGYGDGAGDDLAGQGARTVDPPGGWQQSNLAGTYDGGFSGVNTLGQKDSGVWELTIDANGSITGKGHESINGMNQADAVSGQATVATDGTVTGTVVINGQSQPLTGLLGMLTGSGFGLLSANSVQSQAASAPPPLQLLSLLGTGEILGQWEQF